MIGKPIDRILAMPIACSMSGLALGMTHKGKRSSALNEAKAQIACLELKNDKAFQMHLEAAHIIMENVKVIIRRRTNFTEICRYDRR